MLALAQELQNIRLACQRAGISRSHFYEIMEGFEKYGAEGLAPRERRKPRMPNHCLHYALNLPTSVVITGIDSMKILDQAFEAIHTFQPMSDPQVKALLAKTKKAAARGDFELFKTTSMFDSTAQNPAWLGEEPQRLQQMVPA